MQATQTQPVSKEQGADPTGSFPGLPGEQPPPGARLPLRAPALPFVPAHNDSDLWRFKRLLLKKMWHSNPSVVEILEREINNLRHMVDSSRKALGEKRLKAEKEKVGMLLSYLSLCSSS